MSRKTFGYHLHQFSLTVDIVNDDTYTKFMDVVNDYVKKSMKLDSVTVAQKDSVNQNIGLRVVVGPSYGQSFEIMKDGSINGQTAYAFQFKRPLWVVDREKRTLRETSSTHIDLWNHDDELPQSKKHKGEGVKTSVLVPIVRRSESVGVVEFETREYLEPTANAKDELRNIADAISRIQYLHRSFSAQKENTQESVTSLGNFFREGSWPEMFKPRVFVAFPSPERTDRSVIAKIREILSSFSDKVEVIFWDMYNESGKVDQQIIENITKSQFGVCYFSEYSPTDAEVKFRDNPNVIFEAGMFQSLTNSPDVRPIGWIPIREDNSPPPPFDFGSERILRVKRLATEGEPLNADAFEVDLRNRIEKLLDRVEPI